MKTKKMNHAPMKHWRRAAGIFAIALAAQTVVSAQETTTQAQSSTRSTVVESTSIANLNSTNSTADATPSAVSTSTPASTTPALTTLPMVSTPMISSRDATTPIVSADGIVTSGLSDARNASDTNAPLFTLADALTLALQNNPTIQAAQAAVRAAQARVGTARSTGGAQVGLSGNIDSTRNFGGTSSTGSGVGGGAGSGGVGSGGSQVGNDFLGFNTNESLGVQATLPLYTGGRVKASTRVAQAAVAVQAANALQTQQDLLLNTTTSYLNILRSNQLLTVADSNLDISREQLRIAQVRYDAGAAARLEVFQAQATLADADQRRTSASAALGQNKAALNTLVGRVPETPLRLEPITSLELRLPQLNAAPAAATSTGTTSTSANGTSTNAATGVDSITSTTVSATGNATLSGAQLRTQAAVSRPALTASEAQIAAANASVDLARAQRKPSLGLNLGALLRNPVSFVGRFALSLGLGLTQSLFDSGRSRSQIDEAQALLEQSRAGLSSTRLNIGNQIEQSLLSLDSAQARTASAQTAVTAAQEALRAAQVGYAAGVRTLLDVSTAQTALLTAQTNEVNARFDVATGQAQLASAVGVLTSEEQVAVNRALQVQINADNAARQAEAQKPKKKRKKFLGIF